MYYHLSDAYTAIPGVDSFSLQEMTHFLEVFYLLLCICACFENYTGKQETPAHNIGIDPPLEEANFEMFFEFSFLFQLLESKKSSFSSIKCFY